MIRKVVIPAAGLGTRLLPMTKELPKEMLPIFFKGKSGKVYLKPMLQAIFEQLYDVGFREFCFIVGRGKRAIEDHFTPDWGFVEYLKDRNKAELVDDLQEFYAKIEDSTIIFVNQPRPRGFGDAVFRAKGFTGSEDFLVHAGDDFILSKDSGHVKKLIKALKELKADAVLLVERVKDPRRYGVVKGVQFSGGVIKVKNVVEKPKVPRSDVAIVAVYVFKPKIYHEIDEVEPDESGEIQLTDAIQSLIDRGGIVYAVELEGKRIDVGTSEAYWNALNTTYK
ncbi:MAG: UTP--glucose-1-phosphate uridylyltransferase [Candidatus Bathyarchaeia archaeon]